MQRRFREKSRQNIAWKSSSEEWRFGKAFKKLRKVGSSKSEIKVSERELQKSWLEESTVSGRLLQKSCLQDKTCGKTCKGEPGLVGDINYTEKKTNLFHP